MDSLVGQDGEVYLLRHFYQRSDADQLFQKLRKELAWQEENIIIAGKPVKVPRLICWYGDHEAVYQYSGVVHEPLPFLIEQLFVSYELYCIFFYYVYIFFQELMSGSHNHRQF